MTAPAAIEVRQLAKRFGATTVLAPLDLTVPRGAIFALIGHNGAGKSMLMKLLLNIVQPSEGHANVLGMPTSQLRGEAFTRIGYVSESQEMPEWMTVGALMAHLRPMYPRWDDAGLLEELDLPAERKIRELSRGMRMKAALASVLAFGPELLLMDEPFSGLDPAVRTELIQALLDRTHTEDPARATTIVISSHDLDEMESFATHVGFLQRGTLLFAQPIDALLTRCREVTVTFEGDVAASVRAKLPEGCVAAESSGAMLRFVDLRVHVEDHEGAIRALMPDAVQVQSEPMSLRTIFLALNKAPRAEERGRA
ncbi:ABC-2 type transport system ATP-binding protein [Bryocella elongata]|uniref:ABC-2 type transport system ATP-binding protein n=1 Tax=Bryocella elongata TaxID=863522 RepID=A0A1H6C2C7_9BACT|nr:ABC transporter ATP-binding protein [Bryocella elongata]SEG67033.1 ABC-2 type transport system ATP-binding protein [Bryocella elongata]